MKIGILTLPLHTNYGGILQAYALQTVVERMGHFAEILNCSQIKKIPAKWPLVFGKRIVKKYILGRKIVVFSEKLHNKFYPELSKNTQRFISSRIRQRMLSSLSEINENDYDVIIVGSDQIWNPDCFRPMWGCSMDMAFLKFAETWNVKRIAYAASFGKNMWSFSQTETVLCKELVKKFSNLSVRENDGVELCRRYLDAWAEMVPDPTLLLSRNDYINLFRMTEVKKSEGSLLCYILDDSVEKDGLINVIANEKKLLPFRVNSKIEDECAPIAERVQPPVEQWLRGFYDAEFVVTDSFHACVFAIIFKKPFIVYGNLSRGLSRFKSLLAQFEIEDNLITSLDDYSRGKGGLVASNDVVENFRKKGFSFLERELNC